VPISIVSPEFPRSIRRLYEYLHQDDSIFEDGSEAYLKRRAELAEYIAINHLVSPTIGTGLSLNESLASYAANSTGFSFEDYDHENMLDPKFERTLFEDYVQPFFKEMSHDKNYGDYFGEIYKMTSGLYSEYQQTGGYKHWQQQTAKWDAQSTTIVAIAAAPVALMEVAPLYAGLTEGGAALKAASGLGAVVAANQVASDLTAGLREDRQTFLAKGIDKYFPGYGDITVAGLSIGTAVGSLAAYKFGFRATLPDKPIIVTGSKAPPSLTNLDFPDIGKSIAQSQRKHILGDSQRGPDKSYFLDINEAQAVLDAFHAGKTTVFGLGKNNAPRIYYPEVTGTHVFQGKNYPTNVFEIKGTTGKVSIFPINPSKWKP
jgi:hypothetical protein